VKDVITLALEGKFNDAWTLLIELIRVYGMAEKDFLKYANEYLSRQGLLNQGNIAEVMAKYDYRIIVGANPEIQLTALLAEFGRIGHESAQKNR
jgi:replication factor C small subunit